MKKLSTFKLVLCGIFSALSTLTFIIEGLFPPLFLPGARMGLANIFILLSSVLLGGKYGYVTLVVKVCLGSLLSGNIFGIVYALPAGLIALSTELILIIFVKKVSIIAISVVGATINTVVQNLTFCLITDTAEYLMYLPYLALISLLGGIVVGGCVYLILKILPEKYFINNKKSQEKKL